ncbi:hypothetical protein [Cloacibacillus sp. An23]|nr:hypothetical protein [Cloacibacillus sp. An23]
MAELMKITEESARGGFVLTPVTEERLGEYAGLFIEVFTHEP